MDWKMILAGIAVGVIAPAILTFILLLLQLQPNWVLMLILTELAVLAGSLVAAMRSDDRKTRLLNGLAVATICAFFSLATSVSINPETGANLLGILFLLISYGLMGVLGGLARELVVRS
jgi:putative membrane protein (TIGR04086 family)